MKPESVHEQMWTATFPECRSADSAVQERALESAATWRYPGPAGVEEMVKSCQVLPADHTAFMDAAYEEYCLQIERGEAVSIEDFCNRFPGFRTTLRRQLEIHHLIVDHPSLFRECIDTAWPKPGDDVLGFHLTEELGRGAFSRVFRAHDTALGDRRVALKVCCSGANEARILGKLEHENIVSVHSVHRAEDTGLSLICMPYLGRATLRSVLDLAWRSAETPRRASEFLDVARAGGDRADNSAGERIPPRLLRTGTYVDGSVFVGLKIADALAHAHRAGVLHLDLKPSNVLLTDLGCPKILDFNLASDLQVRTPRLGGTLPYMSPEQARCFLDGEDAADLDQRSDIYSFGVLFHELLCGKLPHGNISQTLSSREAAEDLLRRQLGDPLNTPWRQFGVNRRLASIVERCLVPDPSERYESADVLAADLRRELSVVGRGRRWLHAHRLRVLSAAALILVLGLCLTVHLITRDSYPVREYQKGMAGFLAREFQASYDHFTRSLEADPSQPETLFARARASAALGEYQKAIPDMKDAVAMAEDGRKLAFLGYCCNCVGSHGDAVTFYERAMDKGYRSIGLYNNLGLSHYRKGRLQSALPALNDAVVLDGSRQVILHNRAIVHCSKAIREHAPPDEAIQDIEAALTFGECSSDIYASAARILAYAATFDDSWKPKALLLLRLALEHGASLATIESDAFLAQLHHEAAFGETSRRNMGGVTYPPNPPQFIDPLE